MPRKPPFPVTAPITIGLDIGIASVGWAVIQNSDDQADWHGIIDLGVRTFDRAEDGKTGEPLNLARRTARSMRRRLARRVQRLKKLRRTLRNAGLVPSADESCFITPPQAKDPWTLRAEGLDRCLSPDEWARVLYHLIKHRGFYAARKTEESTDNATEGGKLTAGVHRTQALFTEKGYRSIGEMVARDPAFIQAKRNKAGDYKNSFYRKLLREELALLFQSQHTLGNPHASETLYSEVDELFWAQNPALSGDALLKMLGKCTLEKNEYRAAKNTWSTERFIWLTRLNNLRLSDNGERRPLTAAERDVLLNLPYTKKTAVSYADVRKALDKAMGFDPNARFIGLDYYRQDDKAENEKLFEAKTYHTLRKTYERHQLDDLWQQRRLDHPLLDRIGSALTLYKTDDELSAALVQYGCDDTEIAALLEVSFSGFINLSLKALNNILPLMEYGQRYDEACAQIYGTHSEFHHGGTLRTLSPFDYADIRNPVVFRALNQARKVVNELIRRYGTPYAIHVELARDLSRSLDERKKIEREQKGYAEKKDQLRREFQENFPTYAGEPKGKDLLKYRMYKEQHGKCAFSLEPIELERLLEQGYVEVEHVLPYSRSFDDTLNNTVLALTRENRNKGNHTPYEYLDGENNSERWLRFVAWVNSNKSFRQAKKDRLLRKHFQGPEEKSFAERNLNDTRYATRYFAAQLRQYLRFSDASNKMPVLTPAGGYTALLRARWGLIKVREDSDLHHALDACVVATASPTLIKRVSDYHRRRECGEIVQGGYVVDSETGEILRDVREYFPVPWLHFRDEVMARLSLSATQEAATLQALMHYDSTRIAAAKPIWVSRAPKRLNDGALHQETIRSAKYLSAGKSTVRLPLQNLKLSHLQTVKDSGKPNEETLVGLEDPRNASLVQALRERLEAFNGDAGKAFAQPLHKPLVDGSPGPIVRTVKVFSVQKGGVPVRGGVADQASMWRVDVFEKAGKYYLVPIYQSDRKKGGTLPDRAATAGKSREDWVVIDETFIFCFSLCMNDVVELRTKDNVYFGYFGGLGIATASITIKSHDNNVKINTGKTWQGTWTSLGVKTGILSFKKYHVDVLGNVFPTKLETRHGLA